MNYKKKYLKLNCSEYRHKIKIIPEAEAITNVLNVQATFVADTTLSTKKEIETYI